MKSVLQKSVEQGINLRGTTYQGMSAAQLRQANPKLAKQWARFISENKEQLVKEIAGIVCAS